METLFREFTRLSNVLTEALANLKQAGKDWASKEDAYRKAKAKAFLKTVSAKNKEIREAIADPEFANERLQAFLAEAHKESCLEAVRSLRTQMSALQTVIAARRSEYEASSYGQV